MSGDWEADASALYVLMKRHGKTSRVETRSFTSKKTKKNKEKKKQEREQEQGIIDSSDEE